MKKIRIAKVIKFEDQNIIIRYPQLKDVEDLRDLMNALVSERAFLSVQKKKNLREERKWLASLMKDIKGKQVVHLVAEVEGKIIGNCQVVRASQTAGHHIGTFGIMIRHEYQNKGLGKKLLKIVIQEAKKVLKVKMIILTVMSPNLRARRVYHACGFKEYGRLKRGLKHYGRYVNEICMVKYL